MTRSANRGGGSGSPVLVAPSGDGHCAFTKGNPPPCELEMKREIIMHSRILFGSPARRRVWRSGSR